MSNYGCLHNLTISLWNNFSNYSNIQTIQIKLQFVYWWDMLGATQ